MKGLELSRLYYKKLCSPMLKDRFPALISHIAAGLVGEGSECYGFDDEISRDHDWGPAVCLWLNQSDYNQWGSAINDELGRLPKSFYGFDVSVGSKYASDRRGVFEIEQFYCKYIGYDHVPNTLHEWLVVPETNLATVTNGEVFSDPSGEFTRFRKGLLSFYPEDVRLKKIAARCMKIAQAGQYNFPRCITRKEYVAARMAEAEFIDAAGSIIFLMNRHYKPFYKWMHRGLKVLPILGREMSEMFSGLVSTGCNDEDAFYKKKIDLIEKISAMIICELKNQGLSDSESDFLLDHGPSVQSRVKDARIRNLNVLFG